ncbi:MAG: aldehyde dehydrogenase family protein [Candidatus Omnitrophica bacterium]|nr:aldehyde dehydrogenase family protein [Candidatus Omnitrophota bacterium]
MSGQKNKIINPCDGTGIAELQLASLNEVGEAIAGAREAFDHGPWPRLSPSQRKEYLLRIAQGILEKAGELAELESKNTGKPIKESTFMDIPSSAKAFEFIAQNFERYLNDETPKLEVAAEAKLLREPLGVVVLIVPWNYPLLIACWKAASALAAGNTVILKPSSLTPLTALELEKIIRNAGLPDGVFSVINAGGDAVGKALVSDRRVDMVSFTGSNAVGKKILEYSSQNVKKIIMELGGKSASIVLADADIETAVNGSLCSIFLNQGQMCTAMSRIFVQDKVYDKFLSDFAAKAKKIRLGDSLDHETQMGPLISEAQRKRVIDFVTKAKKEGARLVCGGKIPEDAKLKRGFFFEPTVFADVKKDSVIFKEEIFGPVVIINRFTTPDEAVELANASDFALAACIWGKDGIKAQELAKKVNAGTVWINTYGMFYNELPFGGFKQSGFGKELGREGFLEYTRLKNIIVDKSEDGKPLVNYWYGG